MSLLVLVPIQCVCVCFLYRVFDTGTTTHTCSSPSSIPVRQDSNEYKHAEISLSRAQARPGRSGSATCNDWDYLLALINYGFTCLIYPCGVFFLSLQRPNMEELTIWEQHTITLNKVHGGQERIRVFGFTCGGWRVRHHPRSHDG